MEWQLIATNKIFDNLSDEQLMHEVSPGRNRGIYLLGHLTAVHDLMLPLLRFGEAKYPRVGASVALVPLINLRNTQWHKYS